MDGQFARRAHRAAFAVALVGMGTSAFLAWEYARGGTIACPVAGTGCDVVRTSGHGDLLGVPVPWFGISFYGAFAVLEIVHAEAGAHASRVSRMLLAMATVGTVASAWFTYLEAFVIGAWCFWCVVSAACAVAMLLLSTIGVARET